MADRFTLLPAQQQDIPAIAVLEQECFSHPWSEASLTACLQNGRSVLLTAKEGDTLLGYLGMEYVLDEGSITNVAVFPAYRRRGIAAALLEALLQKARELALATVTLEVRAGNSPAIALYQKYGFLPVGRRKNYYNDPTEDAILMTVTLAE